MGSCAGVRFALFVWGLALVCLLGVGGLCGNEGVAFLICDAVFVPCGTICGAILVQFKCLSNGLVQGSRAVSPQSVVFSMFFL